jgi:hypothetical protein
LNLSDLRTTSRLRDSDFAAIRARVLSELEVARRRRRFMFAFATAAIVALVISTRLPEERRRPGGWSAGVLAGARETRAHQPAGGRRSSVVHTSATPTPRRLPAPPAEELHIEPHTVDPDIRIIWIVNPTPPEPIKEES